MAVHGLKTEGPRVWYHMSCHSLHRHRHWFQLMVYDSAAPDGCVSPVGAANSYEKLVILKCTILV